MIALDVNVLVHAHRADAAGHDAYRGWLEDAVNAELPFALFDIVLSGFIRVVTHPRVFASPTPLPRALSDAESLRTRPNCVVLAPGPRHWDLFQSLCRAADARGNLVSDAYLAALAIETGSEWITTDRDFARFPGLRWRHPFD